MDTINTKMTTDEFHKALTKTNNAAGWDLASSYNWTGPNRVAGSWSFFDELKNITIVFTYNRNTETNHQSYNVSITR